MPNLLLQQSHTISPKEGLYTKLFKWGGDSSWKTDNQIQRAKKESSVRQPGASGFCYWASEFCF